MFEYMHNNNNNYYYQCKMCWNKPLTFGVGSIKLSALLLQAIFEHAHPNAM